MKKLIMGLLAGIVLCGAASTALAEIEVTGDAYAGVYTHYVWRGFDILPDDNISVQTGADISFKGFTVGWWGALEENTGNMIETDLILDYSHDFGDMVSASIGNILYTFDGETTNELYISGTLNTLLSPTLAFYYDYDEFESTYTTLGISHALELAEKLTLGLGAQISYYGDDADSWFHNIELPVNLGYAVTDQVSIDASFLYSGSLSDEAKLAGITDQYVGGLAATLAF